MEEKTTSASNYPYLSIRVKAIIIDSIIMVLFILLATYLFSLFKDVPDYVRLGVFVFIFLLYEPIFVSSFGYSIGHLFMGLKVKREKNQLKNLLLPVAILRFIIKSCLGWISLITVTSNEKRKAIHDMLTGSIVLYND